MRRCLPSDRLQHFPIVHEAVLLPPSSIISDVRSGAALIHRAPPHLLQRLGLRAASMPVGVKPQPDHAIVDARPTPPRPRAGALSRAFPVPAHAGFQIQRMKPIQNQQARDKIVAAKRIHQLLAPDLRPVQLPGSAPIPAPCRSISTCTSSCAVRARWDRQWTQSCGATLRSIPAAAGTPLVAASLS